MIYTFFIYFIIYSFTIFFAYIAKIYKIANNKLYHVFLVFSVLFYSLIIGLRYDVGLDYGAYFDLVNGYNIFELERVELFPRYLTLFVQNNHIPFYVWFMIMAGISIYFIEKVFCKDLVFLLPISVLLYLLYYLDFNVNVVRQACAVSIVLFSYSFIRTKELIKFLLTVSFAFLFHKSSLVALPFYWLISDYEFINKKWQYAIFLLMSIFGYLFLSILISRISFLLFALGYTEQLEIIAEQQMLTELDSGYGVIMNFIRYSIFILLYKQVGSYFKNKGFYVFYKIFFVGICLYSTTMGDVMLSRINTYFLIADVAVSSYMYYYMLKINKRYRLIAVGLLTIQFMMAFQAQVINVGLWKFVNIY